MERRIVHPPCQAQAIDLSLEPVVWSALGDIAARAVTSVDRLVSRIAQEVLRERL